MCSKTYPVYPQTVAVLEVLVHVKPFRKNFTASGEITGRVKAVKKKSGNVKREIEVGDMFKEMKLFGANGFEELKQNGRLAGVVFKATGKIEGKVGISSEVRLRQEEMNRNKGKFLKLLSTDKLKTSGKIQPRKLLFLFWWDLVNAKRNCPLKPVINQVGKIDV